MLWAEGLLVKWVPAIGCLPLCRQCPMIQPGRPDIQQFKPGNSQYDPEYKRVPPRTEPSSTVECMLSTKYQQLHIKWMHNGKCMVPLHHVANSEQGNHFRPFWKLEGIAVFSCSTPKYVIHILDSTCIFQFCIRIIFPWEKTVLNSRLYNSNSALKIALYLLPNDEPNRNPRLSIKCPEILFSPIMWLLSLKTDFNNNRCVGQQLFC